MQRRIQSGASPFPPSHHSKSIFAQGRIPLVPEDLADWLEKAFAPRCIRADESLDDHRHYAGQVELAQKLIRMARRGEASEAEVEV